MKDPAGHGPKVRDRVVARSLAIGEEQLRKGRTSAALTAFGRALALDPQNAQAKGRVERIRRRERLLKYGRRAMLVLAAAAALWVVGLEVRAAVMAARARAAAERAEREKVAAAEKARADAEADRAVELDRRVLPGTDRRSLSRDAATGNRAEITPPDYLDGCGA